MILQYVERNPGVRFQELKRGLGLPHGVLVHHLRVLHGQALIALDRDGRRLGFRLPHQPRGSNAEPEARTIVHLLVESPGLGVSDLGKKAGWTRSKAQYWVSRLIQSRAISRDASGLGFVAICKAPIGEPGVPSHRHQKP